jgi:hypothetical protein
MKKTIADIVCPKCKSDNWYQYDTDECNFRCDGTGHYRFDIHCKNCKEYSRIFFKFTYAIEESEDTE